MGASLAIKHFHFRPFGLHDSPLNIIDYTVQEWGVSQANTYLDGLESRAKPLAENPDLGTTRETLSERLLSFPYESHILHYKNTPAAL